MKKAVLHKKMRNPVDMDPRDLLVGQHIEVTVRKRANIFNLGIQEGADYIRSKTDRGMLISRLHKNGRITHRWSN